MSGARGVNRGRRLAAAVIAAGLIAMLTTSIPVAAAPIGVDPNGQWGPVESWPLIAIHAALTPDGNVVTYGTNGTGRQTGYFSYDVWDSTGAAGTGHTTLPNTTQTDLFCSIQLVRPESGKLVLFGGDNWTGNGTTNTGNPDINVYDPATQGLSPFGTMLRPRWYATAITLPDGSIYLQGGLDGNDIAEHWSESTGSIQLPFDPSDLHYWYPRNFVLEDGRIFGFDVNGKMYFISADLQTLTPAGTLPYASRGIGSSAVMYAPGKILQFGGNSDNARIIDVNGSTPVVTTTDSLSSHRDWVEGVLLPDGRILAVGGSEVKNELIGVNNAAEIWDPATGLWTVAAEGAVPRLYHSTALLLPDGRVLVAGGGAPGPLKNTNAEIYSPDYLVAANGSPMPRPAITALSTASTIPGADIVVTVDDAADIDRVTLLKTGSVTHSFNFEQRIIDADFSVSGNNLTVELPLNPAQLTPGHYLVSVIDDQGIPSPSEIIQVKPLPTPTIVPGGAARVEPNTGANRVISIPFTLSHAYNDDITVDFTTLDVPGNTVIASSVTGDYVAKSGTLTFPAGTTTGKVDVTITGDNLDEIDEYIVVSTSNPVNAKLGGFYGLGLGLIQDNDAPPRIIPGGAAIDEGSAPATVSVPFDLSAPSAKTITVNWSTYEDPANPALASSAAGDFVAATGSMTFLPGVTRQYAAVNVLPDLLVEPDEYVVVSTSNPVNATLGGFYGLGLGIIADDDGP